MQPPQPVHFPASVLGSALPPGIRRKRIAPSSQWSWQARHCTALSDRHPAEMRAFQGQATSPESAPVSQAAVQSPQKVQAPRVKSRMGNPSPSRLTIRSGQARAQAPHWSQMS